MGKGIRVSDMLVDLARTEGGAMQRSIGAQVEHWARIGRAIEHSPDFDYADVMAALAAEKPVDDLSAKERAFYQEVLTAELAADSSDSEIERLKREGLPRYGVDAQGRTVRVLPDGTVEAVEQA